MEASYRDLPMTCTPPIMHVWCHIEQTVDCPLFRLPAITCWDPLNPKQEAPHSCPSDLHLCYPGLTQTSSWNRGKPVPCMHIRWETQLTQMNAPIIKKKLIKKKPGDVDTRT